MCGIVGHIGPQNAVESVLEGLKRLEYRGYDSAGVCFKDTDGQLHLYKKSGKLGNLRKLLEGENYSSHSCVAAHCSESRSTIRCTSAASRNSRPNSCSTLAFAWRFKASTRRTTPT